MPNGATVLGFHIPSCSRRLLDVSIADCGGRGRGEALAGGEEMLLGGGRSGVGFDLVLPFPWSGLSDWRWRFFWRPCRQNCVQRAALWFLLLGAFLHVTPELPGRCLNFALQLRLSPVTGVLQTSWTASSTDECFPHPCFHIRNLYLDVTSIAAVTG